MLPKRFCLIRHRYYPGDGRLENQVKAAQEAGFEVSVVVMKGANQSFYSKVDGAHVYRLPAMDHVRGSLVRYAMEYLTFLISVFYFVTVLHVWRRQHVIESTNLPDFLVFALVIPRLLGAKVVQDFRECTPELYASDYGIRMESPMMKMLIAIEQMSIRFSSLALTCTEPMRRKFIERGAPADKVKVMLNIQPTRLLENPVLPDPAAKVEPIFRLMTHGTIKARYGHETLIRAVKLAKEKIPGVTLEIAGQGELRPELEVLVKELGLEDTVTFTGFLSDEDLIKHLTAAEVGIVPLIKTPDTDLIHTFKMFDYISIGKPIIISETVAVTEYFGEESMRLFPSGDAEALAQAIVQLYNDPALRAKLAKNAYEKYQEYSAEKEIAYYAKVLQELVA
jgi:glycosyltransferase involved in cell wall biosynthesis